MHGKRHPDTDQDLYFYSHSPGYAYRYGHGYADIYQDRYRNCYFHQDAYANGISCKYRHRHTDIFSYNDRYCFAYNNRHMDSGLRDRDLYADPHCFSDIIQDTDYHAHPDQDVYLYFYGYFLEDIHKHAYRHGDAYIDKHASGADIDLYFYNSGDSYKHGNGDKYARGGTRGRHEGLQ